MTGSPAQSQNRKSNARAAAAQAVVAVRHDLPLASTDLFMQAMPFGEGKIMLGAGAATLVEGSAQRWIDALPDPKAREQLTGLATMAGAVCVSEGYEGRYPGNGVGQDPAIVQMYKIARELGLGGIGDPAADDWIGQRVSAAHETLIVDGEAAWNHVRVALETRGQLTGDEVRELVAESDASPKGK